MQSSQGKEEERSNCTLTRTHYWTNQKPPLKKESAFVFTQIGSRISYTIFNMWLFVFSVFFGAYMSKRNEESKKRVLQVELGHLCSVGFKPFKKKHLFLLYFSFSPLRSLSVSKKPRHGQYSFNLRMHFPPVRIELV